MCARYLLLLPVLCGAFARADNLTFDRTVAADPNGSVEISNVSGVIDVSGWDNPQVSVHAQMGSGADRVDVTSDHGRTIVKVVPNHSLSSVDSVLHVRVPRKSQLDVSGVNSEVSETNVEGALSIKTVSGTIKADVFDKSAEIKTVSGDVVLRGHGKDGSIRVSTISGNLRVDRAAGDLEATTSNGDLTLRFDSARNVRVRTTSGDASFEGRLSKGARVDEETVSGELTVRGVPEGGLEYEVTTFSGDIRNCMGVESQRVSQYSPGHRLSGSKGAIGADSARIRLKSMSGDVEICDKS